MSSKFLLICMYHWHMVTVLLCRFYKVCLNIEWHFPDILLFYLLITLIPSCHPKLRNPFLQCISMQSCKSPPTYPRIISRVFDVEFPFIRFSDISFSYARMTFRCFPLRSQQVHDAMAASRASHKCWSISDRDGWRATEMKYQVGSLAHLPTRSHFCCGKNGIFFPVYWFDRKFILEALNAGNTSMFWNGES